MRSVKILLCCALFATALTACGKKGPLYIPEQQYPQTQTAPEPATPENQPIKSTK
jgi:predicted small lipoprotein YifL